jgi:hypothetical protein
VRQIRVVVGQVNERFLLQNETLVGRSEAMRRLREIVQRGKEEIASRLSEAMPSPERENKSVCPQVATLAQRAPAVFESSFQDPDDDASFDDCTETIEP